MPPYPLSDRLARNARRTAVRLEERDPPAAATLPDIPAWALAAVLVDGDVFVLTITRTGGERGPVCGTPPLVGGSAVAAAQEGLPAVIIVVLALRRAEMLTKERSSLGCLRSRPWARRRSSNMDKMAPSQRTMKVEGLVLGERVPGCRAGLLPRRDTS